MQYETDFVVVIRDSCIKPDRLDTNFKRRFEADPRSIGFAAHLQKQLNPSRVWWLGRFVPLELIILIESWLDSEPYFVKITLDAAGYCDERHVENLWGSCIIDK